MKIRFFRTLSVFTLAILTVAQVSTAATRPNIIVILCDDMGYSDIGCYGSEVETPNLDQLASNGVRFTQFYNTARCCPTRASLLTGLYPHQAGVGWMMTDNGHDGYRGNLNRNCVTIAEALKPAGYSTYMSGKWHVTSHVAPEGPKHNWPLQRGFDRFYGTIHGAGSFYDPNSLTRGNTQITPVNDPEYKPKHYYYTDAISDNAVKYINEHNRDQKAEPFFMYVAYTAAHWPMHALEKDIKKYRGKYDAGYEAIRKARHVKMKKLGVIEQNQPLPKGVGEWWSVENKAWEAACMEVYAAMIDNMDQGIGRIVKELKANGQLDNTLILFVQDNGGCAEGLGRKPRGEWTARPDKAPFKPMGKDELQFDMIPKQTRDGFPTIMGEGAMPGPDGTYIAYGREWANVSNTPFREYKHWVHEGGVSTPLIAHWPSGIKRSNALEKQPGHLIDLMATCVDVSGAAYPEWRSGRRIKPMEGQSLVGAFNGKPLEREAIYWEHEGNRAVRQGKWKLVAKGATGPWELYNIETDRSEQADLSKIRPEQTEELRTLWEAYAKRADVLPLTPYYKKKGNKGAFNRKKKFTLKHGADLAQDKAPFIEKKAFTFTATVTPAKDGSPNGVILAQGGTAHGFAVYVQEGKLRFATRHNGRLTIVSAESSAPNQRYELEGSLAADGLATLSVNGKTVTSGKTPGTLTTMPIDGLQVGRDANGAVGDYQEPFAYSGKVTLNLKISK